MKNPSNATAARRGKSQNPDRIPLTISCNGKVISRGSIARDVWMKANKLAEQMGIPVDELANRLILDAAGGAR